MVITESLISGAVALVGIVAVVLMGVLTVKIYMSEQPKQRASVEPEVDDNGELT